MRDPAANHIIAGKYRLESLIGHGGMGSVWRARHTTLDMPVAIKFMGAHTEADQESRRRFDREARALAALRTPNIVQVIDHGVDEDTPYIVMEFLEGEDLSSRLTRKKRLDIQETSRILSQTARGLRRAHDAGVIHRDLKPSNIFLARIDDEEVVKVLDFGVAKLAAAGALGDAHLTRTGTLLGSPGYMSPEQARGKDVDFRSDLWALAVIVFRALTGVKPFAGDSIAELVIKLCIDPRPVPTRVAPDLPPEVDRFFEKAFAAAPEDRFQSAAEMASAFASMFGQPGLEMSRIGANPVSGASAAVLDVPAAPPAPTPAAPALKVEGAPYMMGPAGTVVLAPKKSPSQPAPPVEGASPAVVIPTAPALSAAMREPTPTPASFAGFAPSSAETSAPPAADPSALSLADAPLGAPPIGGLAAEETRPGDGADAEDQRTPTGMRLHPPGPPPIPLIPPPPPAPVDVAPSPSRPRFDIRIGLFAAAGAAVLAIFFALAIAGLRRRHTTATVPSADTVELDPTAAPSAAPTGDTASAEPQTAAPAPSAEPSSTASAAPSAEPEPIEMPLDDPTAAPTATATAPKTHSTVGTSPTTKSTGKTSPTGTTKTSPTGTTKTSPTSTSKFTPVPTGTTKKKPPTKR